MKKKSKLKKPTEKEFEMFTVYGCILGMINEEERFASRIGSGFRPARSWYQSWQMEPRMQSGYATYMKVYKYLSLR